MIDRNMYPDKMKRIVLALLPLVLLGGCHKPSPNSPQNQDQGKVGANGSAGTPTRTASGGAGDSGTITPIGSNVGPITPVAGGENLDGGTGGGIAQAAKGKAHDVANQSTNDATSAASSGD
jgi:hypothetical protein